MLRLDRWTRRRCNPPFSMESGDFVKIIESHKHPHLTAIGVLSHTSPQATKPREAKGLPDRYGTIWTMENWCEREFLSTVRCGIIPWKGNGKEIAWDESWERYVLKTNRMIPVSPVVGWRDTLTSLVKGGQLRPSPFMSKILLENSYTIPEREWRIW